MSDPSRKDFSTQIAEKVTPDSHKTTGEKIKEKLTGITDDVKRVFTPNTEKSLPQQAVDNVKGESENVGTGTHTHSTHVDGTDVYRH
jgi:hypothetical protein